MPSRSWLLPDVLESLLSQDIDRLYLYLNGYPRSWEPPKDDRLIVARSQDHDGDLGAWGKFWGMSQFDGGYYLSCDDDILYPGDYVQETIRQIERFSRRAVISHHGSVIQVPCTSYLRSRSHYQGFSARVKSDTFVNLVGTGVMGVHTDLVRLGPEDMISGVMADLSVSLVLRERRIPVVVPKHEAEWLTDMCIDRRGSVYHGLVRDDSLQTQIVNALPDWEVLTITG